MNIAVPTVFGADEQPGDALGVLAHNAPQRVARVLELTGLDPYSLVDIGSDNMTLEEALLTRFDIKPLSRQRVEHFVERIVDGVR